MVENTLVIIENFLSTHLFLTVFLSIILQEIIAPIPSTAIVLMATYFVVEPGLSFGEALGPIFFYVVIPVSLGVMLGSFFLYGIAYWGGRPAFIRWGRLIGTSWEDIEKAKRKFTKGPIDEFSIFILRAIPIIPVSIISLLCGAVRVKWRTFGLFTFLGIIVRSFYLGFIGWKVGDIYKLYIQEFVQIEQLIKWLAALVIVVVVVYLVLKKRKK